LRRRKQPRAAEIMRTLKPGGRYVVSVHHYGVEKQHAGWKKEGVPGGDRRNSGYIFCYTRAELAALFPDARIRAMGFYGYPAQGLIARACALWIRAHALRLRRREGHAAGLMPAPPSGPARAASYPGERGQGDRGEPQYGLPRAGSDRPVPARPLGSPLRGHIIDKGEGLDLERTQG
jgi:hypothetical protein